MDSQAIVVAFIATCCFALTLVRFLLFKRELFKLKSDMKQHVLEKGIDNELWSMFDTRTRKMFNSKLNSIKSATPKKSKKRKYLIGFLILFIIHVLLTISVNSDLYNEQSSYILKHKVIATLGYSSEINYLGENGDSFTCQLPSGSKIETIKALFAKNEKTNSPKFEINITYPDNEFSNGYVAYTGQISTMFFDSLEKKKELKNQCQKQVMLIKGSELHKLLESYRTNSVFVAPATADYYRG
ncbi:TPA: hypothetical protein ACX6S7_002453 [Photobacterium damselae]